MKNKSKQNVLVLISFCKFINPLGIKKLKGHFLVTLEKRIVKKYQKNFKTSLEVGLGTDFGIPIFSKMNFFRELQWNVEIKSVEMLQQQMHRFYYQSS